MRMGGVDSHNCKPMIDADALSVITLSDACVQRLPIVADSPLEQETREKSIDDFWRERLKCLDKAYSESLGVTEVEFLRLERVIRRMAPEMENYCMKGKDAVEGCLLTFNKEPVRCNPIIHKFLTCIDAMSADKARRKHLEELRLAKKLAKKPECESK